MDHFHEDTEEKKPYTCILTHTEHFLLSLLQLPSQKAAQEFILLLLQAIIYHRNTVRNTATTLLGIQITFTLPHWTLHSHQSVLCIENIHSCVENVMSGCQNNLFNSSRTLKPLLRWPSEANLCFFFSLPLALSSSSRVPKILEIIIFIHTLFSTFLFHQLVAGSSGDMD